MTLSNEPNDDHDPNGPEDEPRVPPASGAEPLPPPPSPWGQSPAGPYAQAPYGQPGYGQPPSDFPPPSYAPPGYGQQPPPGWPEQPQYPRYPQYPQAPQPPLGYYPGPMPQRRSNRGLWTACGIVAAVLLLLCIAVGIAAFAVVRNVGPAVTSGAGVIVTVGEFCAAAQRQDYAAAYSLLSSGAQAQVTETAFTQASQASDTSAGMITHCGTASDGGHLSIHSRTASIVLQITRNQQTTGTVGLVLEGSRWKIDSLDPSLGIG